MPQCPCVLQCGQICDSENRDSLCKISTERWETIKKKSKLWRGLDKFGDVFDSVDWDKGPSSQCVHDRCRLALVTQKQRKQAIKRYQSSQKPNSNESQKLSSSFACNEPTP